MINDLHKMMQDILRIVGNAQLSPSNCQRNIRLMKELFNRCNYEEFLEINLKIIVGALQQKPEDIYARNIIQFYTEFVGYLTVSETAEANVATEPLSLLEDILEEVLKFLDVCAEICQQNACAFVSKTLQNLDNLCLNDELCQSIEDAMLKKIWDVKPSVRIQAILALNHLQVPSNPDCPIINTLLSFLHDPVCAVRREVVKILAPTAVTIQDLKNCVLDSDHTVRVEAYKRCMSLEPKYFKIVDRQLILRRGLSETKAVRKVVTDNLIPKWLSDLKGDYVAFLRAIKLDADEFDILISEDLSKKLVEVFFKNEPINSIMKSLALEEGKVLPLDIVNGEITLYWNLVAHYLKSHDELEDFLDMALPELTAFCNFIDSVVKKKKTSEQMDQYEYLELQYILYNLFDIVDVFDMSDEMGRRTLEKLLKNILENVKVEGRLLTKIVHIARKLWTNLTTFVNEMSEIISNIREPLTQSEPSQNAISEAELKVAGVKVQINILKGNLETALDAKEFLAADTIQKELDENQIKLEQLLAQSLETEYVRVIKNDPETTCRCLNLLYETLKHYNLRELSLTLTMWKDELLLPLLSTGVSPTIEPKLLKCLAIYCLLDHSMAQRYGMQFFAAIVSHQNKSSLLVAIGAISDFLKVYGISMFESPDASASGNSSTISHQRRLYRDEDVDLPHSNATLNPVVIVEMILDLMDDEDEDVKITAAEAIGKVLISDYPTTPHIITRLVLKLFNPLTEKLSVRLQQRLGIMLEEYVNRIMTAKKTLVEAVIPIFKSITNSPLTSPLRKINMDSLIKFLVLITNPHSGHNHVVNVHRTLVFSILKELADHPGGKISVYLAKTLNLLQIETVVTQEIIAQCRLVLNEEDLDKSSKSYITKFVTKISAEIETITESSTAVKTINVGSTVNCEENTQNAENERTENAPENVDNEPPQTTRLEEVTTGNENCSQVSNLADSVAGSDSDVIPSSISPEPTNSLGSSLRKLLRSSKHKHANELPSATPASKKLKVGVATSLKNSKKLDSNQNQNMIAATNLKDVTNSTKIKTTVDRARKSRSEEDDLSKNELQSNTERRAKYDRAVKSKRQNSYKSLDNNESDRVTTDTDNSLSIRSLRSNSSSSIRSKHDRENDSVEKLFAETPKNKLNAIKAQTEKPISKITSKSLVGKHRAVKNKRQNSSKSLDNNESGRESTDTDDSSSRAFRSRSSSSIRSKHDSVEKSIANTPKNKVNAIKAQTERLNRKITSGNLVGKHDASARSLRSKGTAINGVKTRRNILEGGPVVPDSNHFEASNRELLERHQIVLRNLASNHIVRNLRREKSLDSAKADNDLRIDLSSKPKKLKVQNVENQVKNNGLQVKRKKCRGGLSNQVVMNEFSNLRNQTILYETSSDSGSPDNKLRKSSRIRSAKN